MPSADLSIARRHAPYREGEDVPVQVEYTADDGTSLAPDGVSDSSGPTVTVTAPDDTDVVSSTVMTEKTTGTYEHVWDTAGDSAGMGKYIVEVKAELNGETDITKKTVEIQ